MSVIPESWTERRRRMRDEAQSGSTFHQHAVVQADDTSGGRFAATGKPTVVGGDPIPKYPQLPASSPWSGLQPDAGPEPATGYRIDAMPEFGQDPTGHFPVSPPVVTGGPSNEQSEADSNLPVSSDRGAGGPPSSSPHGDGPVELVEGPRMPSASQMAGPSPPASNNKRSE